jgi:uncharacterized protein YsxB (DUF464 family)
MIKILIMRGSGFEIENHGKSIVCAAVSALAINAANSIEKFTRDKYFLEAPEEGGLMKFKLLGAPSRESELLLKSLELGLESIEKEYPKQIKISYSNTR